MSEHSEQVALSEWAAWQVNLGIEPLRWIFAIPNGGLRTEETGSLLKSEGVKAGVSDIMLPHPTAAYCGLFIEMKFGRNKPTKNQIAFIDAMNKVGYLAKVAYGFDEAKAIIVEYLKMEE